jgi:hypothetical protein
MQTRSEALLRRVTLLPAFSTVVFACLYALAAWVYPGGTKGDPHRVGFSLVDNYWCDLLDGTTYGGRPNPSRPIAQVATVVLCAGLSVLWWTVPTLFPGARRRVRLVRSAGLASVVLTPFVGTSLHDLAIDSAAPLGTIAFAATMSAMGKGGGRAWTFLAWSALSLSVVTFLIWRTGTGLRLLPLVQKAAFGTMLGWIVLTSRRVAGTAAGTRAPEG